MTNWQYESHSRMIANAVKEKGDVVQSYRPTEQQTTKISDGIRPELLTAPRMVWKRKPPAILESNPFLARL